MRNTLAEHGTGSQLNLYISQDARLEVLRTMDFTHNSLIEAKNTLASNHCRQKCVHRAVERGAEPGSGDDAGIIWTTAKSSYEKASSTKIWFA